LELDIIKLGIRHYNGMLIKDLKTGTHTSLLSTQQFGK